MASVRLILYQKPLGTRISRRDAEEMKGFSPHFTCFPEYFFVNKRLGNHGQTPHNQQRQLHRIETISRCLDTVVIGGSMPERDSGAMHNTCFIYDRGIPLGFYRKRNLFFAEEGTITPGDRFETFTASGITFGVLICADVFHDESFMVMKEKGAKIIFIPTFSLKREETQEEKFRRDNDIFVRGAAIADALIVKVCGVKSAYKDFLQARSLIADRTGVLFRVRPDQEDTPMIIKYEVNI